MTAQPNNAAWIPDGEKHSMLYWHMPIPGTKTGLFLSLGTLGLLAEVKYAATNEKGEWYRTLASYEFYCEELSEKGICPETEQLVKDTALAVVQNAFLSKTKDYQDMTDTVNQLGITPSGWYCPYGGDKDRYAKKHLTPSITATLHKMTDICWRLGIDMGDGSIPVGKLNAETKLDAQRGADKHLAEHPEYLNERNSPALVLTEQEMRHIICAAAYGLGHGYYDGTRTADGALNKANSLLNSISGQGTFHIAFTPDTTLAPDQKGGN